jgi:hypothetical protein
LVASVITFIEEGEFLSGNQQGYVSRLTKNK